ncbi:MAG: DUF99 family protein [Candidatus Hodarchaeota archaeon]
MKFRQVKEEIRILGVDDARFRRGVDEWTRLVGVVFRGGKWMEGCLQGPIRVDGSDVNEQLARMISESPHQGQLRVIMTADTIFAGVNVLHLPRLVESTGLPVIAVSDSKPDMNRVKTAFQRISPDHWEEKLATLKAAGPIRAVKSRSGRVPIFLQWIGLPFKQAVELVQKTATRSRIPEPVRVAHLIASSFLPDPQPIQ